MRVMITRDYWDGSKSQVTEVDLDGMGMGQLMMMLGHSGCASITITKLTGGLDYAVRHMNDGDNDD